MKLIKADGKLLRTSYLGALLFHGGAGAGAAAAAAEPSPTFSSTRKIPHIVNVMRNCVLLLLLLIIIITDLVPLSESDINIGHPVTLAVPNVYAQGFIGRAFLIHTDQNPPNFRAAISVEAVEQIKKYSCSLDVFLGDVRVWSSAHFARFYASEECVLELSDSGNLRLKTENDRVGWNTGTSSQGVKRLSLLRTGNLVLVDDMNSIKWQSFNFPTDVMVWGQRLSSKTRLTSFTSNSTLFYSMEIKDDKIELFLNYGKSKYSYWEHKPLGDRNITYVEVTSHGLEIYNGKHKFDEIKTYSEPLRFLSLDSTTGNLRLYHYSEERGKFEASYQAINFTCDLPLHCKTPYGICMPSGLCSCIRVVPKQQVCNETNNVNGACGLVHTQMLEFQDMVSVLKSDSWKDQVRKPECSRTCNDDCECAAAHFVEEEEEDGGLGRCYLYRIAGGIKKIERGKSAYMVKVVRGVDHDHGKSFGLKKWVIVLVIVVDVFAIFLVVGGVGYYILRKRKNNLGVGGGAS